LPPPPTLTVPVTRAADASIPSLSSLAGTDSVAPQARSGSSRPKFHTQAVPMSRGVVTV